MSKAVKKVTGTVKKVVKKVATAVKKVAKSKIGKALIVAASIYFGGAALAGIMNGTGAMAGVSSAWSSLGSAASSAMSGQFTTAASHLSAGFGGTTVANAATQLPQLASAAGTMSDAAAYGGAFAPSSGEIAASAMGGAAEPVASLALPSVTGGGAPGMLGQAGQFMSSNKLWGPAIQTGGQMLSGYAQGKAAEEAEERKRIEDEEARARFNRNMNISGILGQARG